MQLTANLFGRKVARPQHVEMSCLGAAFVAGLGAGRPGSEMHSARPSYRNKFQFHYNQRQPVQWVPVPTSCLPSSPGFWRTRDELKRLNCSDKVFVPQEAPGEGSCTSTAEYLPVFQRWERALHRSMNWYGKTWLTLDVCEGSGTFGNICEWMVQILKKIKNKKRQPGWCLLSNTNTKLKVLNDVILTLPMFLSTVLVLLNVAKSFAVQGIRCQRELMLNMSVSESQTKGSCAVLWTLFFF